MEAAKKPALLDSRPAEEDDLPYIIDSWLKSAYRQHRPFGVSSRLFFNEHNRVMPRVLNTIPPTVCFSPSSPDMIIGWICGELSEIGTIVHYVYVRSMFRGSGAAHHLLEAIGHKAGGKIISTAMVGPSNAAQRLKHNIENNPYLFFRRAHGGPVEQQ